MSALKHRLARMPWRRVVAALILVGAHGAVRMPFEAGVESDLRDSGFRDWTPTVSNRDQLAQAGFAGALGGFRSLVALWYNLEAASARMDKDWVENEKFHNVTTSLQPRVWHHWDLAVWDMAWNAYAHYGRIAEEHAGDFDGFQAANIEQPRYLEKGIDFAKRGMKWVPDTFRMPKIIGDIYQIPSKYNDPCAALPWYLEASQKEDAFPFVYRAYVHQMSLCPGMEEKAYELNSALYWSADQRTWTVRHDMERLEDHLSLEAARAAGSRAELEAAVEAPDASYRDVATLAMYLLEVEGDPGRAVQVYRMLATGGEEVPEFYRKKWAFLLARDPERTEAAYAALKSLHAEDPEALLPSDMTALYEIEERLGVDPAERIAPPPAE